MLAKEPVTMSSAKADAGVEGAPNNSDAIAIEHRDHAVDEGFEKMPQVDKIDKFGSHNKIDPLEIALVKKLDRYMLPILWLMYLFNYLDRNAIVNARLNNLEEDLGLVGTQYNTCVSILFVGYIAFQIPSNMLLNRIRPSWYMAGFCLAWSVVSLLTYLANSYATMVVCRLLLGITEAPVQNTLASRPSVVQDGILKSATNSIL
jgi:fucose permease